MNNISLPHYMSSYMRHMVAAVFVAISALCFAQPTGNFTRLRTYTSDDGRQYRDEYTTYDGLGRPNGTVRPRFCPSGLGTATRTEYNAAGLPGREGLPVVFDGKAQDAANADLSQCRSDTYPTDGHPVPQFGIRNSS